MSKEPTPKQIEFIRTLVSERQRGLTPPPEWLKPPKTSFDASRLITLLRGMPSDKAAERANRPEPDEGFYNTSEGIVLVYRARSGHPTTKTYSDERWNYTGQKMFDHCNADNMMTAQEVAELGRRISGDGKGMCVVCLAEGRDPTLTDERSIAVGYGAVCAGRFGWPYPTKEEAERILSNH
jgi:hypothetical protein